MILIELVFDVAPERRDEVVALAARTTRATHQERGWVLYRFSTDIELPNRFVLTELWESEEALKAHFAGQAFRSFFAGLPPGGSFVSSRAWQGPLADYTPPTPGRLAAPARSRSSRLCLRVAVASSRRRASELPDEAQLAYGGAAEF